MELLVLTGSGATYENSTIDYKNRFFLLQPYAEYSLTKNKSGTISINSTSNKGICSGDSGSGVFVLENSKLFLAGINTSSPDCGTKSTIIQTSSVLPYLKTMSNQFDQLAPHQ